MKTPFVSKSILTAAWLAGAGTYLEAATADLGLTFLDFKPASIQPGGHPTQLKYSVVNFGPASLGSSFPFFRGEDVVLNMYLSRNNTYGDTDDVSIGQDVSSLQLSAGFIVTTTVNPDSPLPINDFTIPMNATGTYWVFLRLSYPLFSTFFDPDSSDNISMLSFSITVVSPCSSSSIVNQTIRSGETTVPLTLTVSDPSASITAASSNKALVPDANISFGGSGANRTVTVSPLPGEAGMTTISLSVSCSSGVSTSSFIVEVSPANRPPSLVDLPIQSVSEGTPLRIQLTATDPDLPAQDLTYHLVPLAPKGMSIDSATGVISWLPTEAQGPGSYSIEVEVLDSGTPPLRDTTKFLVRVEELNAPPVLGELTDRAVEALRELRFQATGMDSDVPQQQIFFSLGVGAPTGARLDRESGVFQWTPTVDQSPGVYTISISATDNGSPPLSASRVFRVQVSGEPVSTDDDFDGDGKSDLILQDKAGYLGIWRMDRENLISPSLLNPGYTDPRWQIRSSADFNGDGNPDLLLQHTDGTLGAWLMDGISLVSPTLLNPPHPGPGWRTVDTGDFNGDGKPDLLFQHSDGTLAVWFMSGTSLVTPALLTPGHPGVGWSAAAAADIDRDGHTDIVLQHSDSRLQVWYLQGVNLRSFVPLNPPRSGATWPMVSSTDLNGDGHADLIFQNTADASLAVWYLNGVNLIKAALLNPQFPGGTWKVVAP